MNSLHIALVCAVLLPMLLFSQENGPTPSEKCRIVTAADLSDAKAPTFGAFPAIREEAVSHAELDLTSNPVARQYRTILRLEIAKGANFAGHYRVASWGCGMSCAMFAVINLKTGRVITASDFGLMLGTRLAADDFLPDTRSDSWGFRYKSDSSLLVVLGAPCEDESREGAYYFALQEDKLRLIHTTLVKKKCQK